MNLLQAGLQLWSPLWEQACVCQLPSSLPAWGRLLDIHLHEAEFHLGFWGYAARRELITRAGFWLSTQ